MHAPKTEQLIEGLLIDWNQGLGKMLQSEVVFLDCPMAQPWDDAFRVAIEQLAMGGNLPAKLSVVLETSGGYIETVERLVRVMRHYFKEVDFIVPNYAYSAGTVLALSGDEIFMDYHSVLGPIDPQFSARGGEFVPGQGYLAKYKELSEKVNSASDASAVRAEIAYLVEKFDPAILFYIEQAIEHSKDLLRTWLPKYKFKNWTHRETTGIPVTEEDKKIRADQIATALGDAEQWHSHGRGISCDDLDNEDIKLKINNYGKTPDLQKTIRNYHGLVDDYMSKRGWQSAIHTRNGFGGTQ